jgi:hypothetical protein
MGYWRKSDQYDPMVIPLADRHYSRKTVGAPKFVAPGRAIVLTTPLHDAAWVTTWPLAKYTKHAWAGAWINSFFRNEGQILSSSLIREAVSLTRGKWMVAPELGMITFIDTRYVRRKRDPGRCYRRAGFVPAKCPIHDVKDDMCDACHSRTKGGLLALQMLPADMPEPAFLGGYRIEQGELPFGSGESQELDGP